MPKGKKKQETTAQQTVSAETTQQQEEHVQTAVQEPQVPEKEAIDNQEFWESRPSLTLRRDDRLHVLELNDLRTFREVGLPTEAQRPIVQEQLNNLQNSDPASWPPISVTNTSLGYVITDGNHRVSVSRLKELKTIRAKSTTYHTINDVIEAAFTANLEHGMPANHKTRSDYAYWLHKTFPDMLQAEIAQRAHITQPSVSAVIMRRDREEFRRQTHEAMQERVQQEQAQEQAQQQAHEAMQARMQQEQAQEQAQQQAPQAQTQQPTSAATSVISPSVSPPAAATAQPAPAAASSTAQTVEHEERTAAERERDRVLRSCDALVRQAQRFWEENQQTDESILVFGLSAVVNSDEERARLSSVAKLLERSVRIGQKKPASQRKQ